MSVKKFRHEIILRLVKLLNIILITVPFALAWLLYYNDHIKSPFFAKGNIFVILLFAILYTIFARIYDALSVSTNKISHMIYNQTLSVLISDGIIFIVICLLSKRFANLLPGLMVIALQLCCSALWSVCAGKWYYAVNPPKRTLIVEDTEMCLDALIEKYELSKKYAVDTKLDARTCLADLSVLENYEVVFLCGVHSHDRNIILKRCIGLGIRAYVIPRIGDTIMSGARTVHLFHLPMLEINRYSPAPEYLFIKRLFDIVISLLALLLLSPLMLAVAIAIKATDGGPVFYRQTRLTKDGKLFEIHKFRSMRVDAEKDGVARLSTGTQDDRITPVGKIIRAIRVDELPQLLDILSGNMTIVGPRPERPEIAEQYEREFPEFRLRLQAKAGLTGYAQIYGKYNTTPYDKLKMDLMYIAHPSVWEDLALMFATVKILFQKESTEGVEVGQITSLGEEAAAGPAPDEAEEALR